MVSITELPPSQPSLPSPISAFSVSHQKVHLEVDLTSQTVRGRTEITVIPHGKDLRAIRLNCRQFTLTRLNINGKGAVVKYDGPYGHQKLSTVTTVHQHHQLRQKLAAELKSPPDEDLTVYLPKVVRVEEIWDAPPAPAPAPKPITSNKTDSTDSSTALSSSIRSGEDPGSRYAPLTLNVEFRADQIRDGLQFVGTASGDPRFPHVYSRNTKEPGSACCLFPCVDDASSRCTWEISITCPRTLGDMTALARSRPDQDQATSEAGDLVEEDAALEMVVACSGELVEEIVDPLDPRKKTVSFFCATAVSAQHIGFAIGPFEHVALSDFRENDEDDKLGQNAIQVHGYCLPGRSDEIRNTCMPIAKAIDHFTLTYGSYPFGTYQLCFVDDLLDDTTETAALSICSNRLLFSEDILDRLDEVTRKLVYSLACQWIGVNIIPAEAKDAWVIVGTAYFITDLFLKKLCGNNDYRFRQKLLADRICDLDVSRPSIHATGALLTLDRAHGDFLALKAPLVLFILDRRLAKASGSSGLPRIISRIFLNAKVGELWNGALTTAHFLKTCEKLGHTRLDAFFEQWVFGAGCPRFQVTQRFNKKKLVVEMLIRQVQADRLVSSDLTPDSLMRHVRDERAAVEQAEVQRAFTGPMTIRIHEADGTPYEHIVEIKDNATKFEIPYNTKYKRMKRSRRQKERTMNNAGLEAALDAQDDVLLYCLGDVLQSEEEVVEWRLADWSKEDEERMSLESYEWIRMDADFEWICKTSLGMPGYMYLSQLQQDRDVVAQYESIQYIATQRETPLVSTILIRTLMDRRYFHGIRTAAAQALAKTATEEMGWLGLFHLEKAFQEMFCYPDSAVTRPNDFSDRRAYHMQCAIPRAIAKARDRQGGSPLRVKRFLYEKLKLNDNTGNEYSDNFYVACLMTALTDCLVAKGEAGPREAELEEQEDGVGGDDQFFRQAMEEIERYRRMDEWIASYHNVYSTTALRCKERLIEAKLLPHHPVEIFQYTREGGLDLLRLEAFGVLVRLGMMKVDLFLEYMVTVMSTDSSHFLRIQLLRLFERGLAAIALGQGRSSAAEAPEANAGLVIEHEAAAGDARQADLSRTQTVPGALAALRQDMEDDESLKKVLWKAVTSPVVGINEVRDLLEICALLYKPVTSYLVVLRYPRSWTVQHLSGGKLLFRRGEKVRTKKLEPRTSGGGSDAPSPASTQAQTTSPSAPKSLFKKKIKLTSAPSKGGAPAAAAEAEEKPKLTIKLKLPL